VIGTTAIPYMTDHILLMLYIVTKNVSILHSFGDITRLTVHVTDCDLEKSSIELRLVMDEETD